MIIVFISDGSKHLRFDDVVIQSSPQNCTVYCGGIQSGLSGKCCKDAVFQPSVTHNA